MKNISKSISKKWLLRKSSFVVLITLLSLLNVTFSTFTNKLTQSVSNIKVHGMEYSFYINGLPSTLITASSNKTTKSNIIIKSLNDVDSKYELVYKVCKDINCNNVINNPTDLLIEYSSRTTDNVFGTINSYALKEIRIIITNKTNETYYIEFDINAGFIHNTLALQNLIVTEYNEEDLIISAIINGEISTSFPTQEGKFDTRVKCETDEGLSNASGTVTWNGTKWLVNISGIDSGRTICNVIFKEQLLGSTIIEQYGTKDSIEALESPNFSEINGISGLYSAPDNYGMSYYYRGNRTDLNNNLIWAGYQWKIIRINGDGSVRIIFNGFESDFDSSKTMSTTGVKTKMLDTTWVFRVTDDAKYVGYMYGGLPFEASTVRDGTSSAAATYNQTNSDIKGILDSWYKKNILDSGYDSTVIDNMFCNDRQLANEIGGYNIGPGYGNPALLTHYATYYRVFTIKTPSLKCGQKNDSFTVNDKIKGNGALTYPVGLLTADEALTTGLVSNINNTTNYLYNNQNYWTMSPLWTGKENYGEAYMTTIGLNGELTSSLVNRSIAVRPVLNISPDIYVKGDGSATDPYKQL